MKARTLLNLGKTACVFFLSLGSLESLYARELTLASGSWVTLDTVDDGKVRVSCMASERDQTVRCQIARDGGYYAVYSGDAKLNSFVNFDDAIQMIEKLRNAGLCR